MSKEYTLDIDLNVLNHLGLNLYSNVPAVLAELIANAWDADPRFHLAKALHREKNCLYSV